MGSRRYRIQVRGHLDDRWSARLGGFEIENGQDGAGRPVATLRGPVRDQAALYGILTRLRDLGVVLLSVYVEESGDDDDE